MHPFNVIRMLVEGQICGTRSVGVDGVLMALLSTIPVELLAGNSESANAVAQAHHLVVHR